MAKSIETRLRGGERVQVLNSQIKNYQIHHHANRGSLPYELIWCYSAEGKREVCWAFFPSFDVAFQAANDLINAIRDRATGEPR